MNSRRLMAHPQMEEHTLSRSVNGSVVHYSKFDRRLAAVGQKRRFCLAGRTSALPPRAAQKRTLPNRRFVPGADVSNRSENIHSITSSARASRVGGTSRPSALAVFRLI